MHKVHTVSLQRPWLYDIQLALLYPSENSLIMSVQTPHATFAQQHPDTAAPFLYKSQGLPIHVPVLTKSGTIRVRLDQVLNLDCVETDMIVNPQTSPPSGFLNANGTRFQFQLLPSNYCIVHSYVEFDITNTTSLAVQLMPC